MLLLVTAIKLSTYNDRVVFQSLKNIFGIVYLTLAQIATCFISVWQTHKICADTAYKI